MPSAGSAAAGFATCVGRVGGGLRRSRAQRGQVEGGGGGRRRLLRRRCGEQDQRPAQSSPASPVPVAAILRLGGADRGRRCRCLWPRGTLGASSAACGAGRARVRMQGDDKRGASGIPRPCTEAPRRSKNDIGARWLNVATRDIAQRSLASAARHRRRGRIAVRAHARAPAPSPPTPPTSVAAPGAGLAPGRGPRRLPTGAVAGHVGALGAPLGRLPGARLGQRCSRIGPWAPSGARAALERRPNGRAAPSVARTSRAACAISSEPSLSLSHARARAHVCPSHSPATPPPGGRSEGKATGTG